MFYLIVIMRFPCFFGSVSQSLSFISIYRIIDDFILLEVKDT